MLTEQAAWYREALRLGLCSVEDVVQWSDKQILDLSEPPSELFDLSWMGGRSPDEVVNKLAGLSVGVDTLQILPRVLKSAHNRLVEDKSFGPPFAHALARLARRLNYPALLNPVHGIDDDYHMAEQGYFDVSAAAYDQLLHLTSQFG